MKPNYTLCALFLCLSINWGRTQNINDITFLNHEYQVDIPFEYENNFIVLQVMFNDLLPLKFIFDTGAENTILTKREITDILRVDYQKRFTIYGADLSQTLYAYLARGINLRIGEVRATQRAILVLEEDYFKFDEFSGVEIHGILGADFFRRFVVKINYYKQVITLIDPEHFRGPKGKFDVLDLELKRSKPYLMTNTTLSSDTSVMTKLLLDTGASLPLLLYSDTHPDLKPPSNVIRSTLGRGLGGIIYGYLGRVKSMDIQNFKFQEIITNFQEAPILDDTTYMNDRNGIIGNQLLDRFTIYIDYIREKLYLQPNPYYKEEFRFDRSGLVITASGPNLGRFMVLDVVPKSPVAEAGVLPNDELLKINGLGCRGLKLPDVMSKFEKKVGKKMRVMVLRNGQKLNLEFALRDLI
jgi:Aspartyl protease/PDZ domain